MSLRRGSKGPDVRQLQTQLEAFAIALPANAPVHCPEQDGVFGPGTEKAVIEFQKMRQLPVDGIAGPRTLNELNALTARKAPAQKHLDVQARYAMLDRVSRFEGHFDTVNLDMEFEGAFDRPAFDKNHVAIPINERHKQPDFKPISWSKYGPKPAHVGLSFGFVQFTQDGGNLGRLLRAMRDSNPPRFAAIFGPDADELVRVTNLKGAAKVVVDQTSPTGTAARSPRVAPVGGADLWRAPWIERFRTAGREPAFQNVQRELAESLYFIPMLRAAAIPFGVSSEKGVCILLDRSIQLGPGGCAKLLARAWVNAKQIPEAKRFEILYDAVRTKFWSHRVRDLLEDDAFSFDVTFDDIAMVAQAL